MSSHWQNSQHTHHAQHHQRPHHPQHAQRPQHHQHQQRSQHWHQQDQRRHQNQDQGRDNRSRQQHTGRPFEAHESLSESIRPPASWNQNHEDNAAIRLGNAQADAAIIVTCNALNNPQLVGGALTQLSGNVHTPVCSVAIGGDAPLVTHMQAMEPEQRRDWTEQALRELWRVAGPGSGLTTLTLACLPLSGESAICAFGQGSHFQGLRCLRIERCPWLCTESLRFLQHMTEMRVLSLAGCRGLGSIAGYLWPMHKLHTLVLNDTCSSDGESHSTRDVDLLMLGQSTSFYGLRRLHMERTDVSDRGLEVISKRSITLAELSFEGCDRITRTGVESLSKMPELKYLNVNATGVDAKEQAPLQLLNSKGIQVCVGGPLTSLVPLGQCAPNGVQLNTDQIAGSSSAWR